MEKWSGKVAIVTGASRGIGAAIAEALVRNGIKVVGVATQTESIRQLAEKLEDQEGVLYDMKCDLRKEEDILRVFEWTENELGGVDILVNNAGIYAGDPIIDGDTQNFRDIIDINVIAIAISIREATRSMRKRQSAGQIINVNSISGYNADISVPVNLYAASKFAVTAISQGVTNELAALRANIKVTNVNPGPVKTDMMAKIGVPPEVYEKIPICETMDIAKSVIYVLETPSNVQIKDLTIIPLVKLSDVLAEMV